jgi:nucleoside-diphosphate-sugar epimerase
MVTPRLIGAEGMRVLVTGSDGYIGCMLAPFLVERGHDVVGLDTGFYRDGWLYNPRNGQLPRTLNKDLRHVTVEDLRGVDAVVHLAELSNDPLGELSPDITYKINHEGSVRLAQLARQAGVSRFIYASSCSVYGVGEGDEVKTEESLPSPQTAYARCKVMVERDVQAIAGDDFSPTFLRNATAYGTSPRIRFDVVLNNLSGLAWTTKNIKLTSDGTPWRPLVHILDIAEAVSCTLVAPRECVHNQIFNVGDSTENYRVREIAQIVAETFPGCSLSLGTGDQDNRSYRVSFEKIKRHMPGFRCQRTARGGAEQLRGVFEQIGMLPETFGHRNYTRLKQLQHLIRTRQIDDDFFWRS